MSTPPFYKGEKAKFWSISGNDLLAKLQRDFGKTPFVFLRQKNIYFANKDCIFDEYHQGFFNQWLYALAESYNIDTNMISSRSLEFAWHFVQAKFAADQNIFIDAKQAYPHIVPCMGKFIDTRTFKFTAPNKKYLKRHVHPHDFSDTEDLTELMTPGYYKDITEMMLKIYDGDQDMIRIVQQAFGLSFYLGPEYEKFYVFIGPGGSGKSTVFDLLQAAVGVRNTSAVSIAAMKDPFMLASMLDKSINISTENAKNVSGSMEFVKQITSNDVMPVNQKNKAIELGIYDARMFFACNEELMIKDLSGDIRRRMVIVPHNVVFTKGDKHDRTLRHRIKKSWGKKALMFALCGLRDIKENGLFVHAECERLGEQMKLDNDFWLSFVTSWIRVTRDDESFEPTGKVVGKVKEVWDYFNHRGSLGNAFAISSRINKSIKEAFDYDSKRILKRFDGEPTRGFIGIELRIKATDDMSPEELARESLHAVKNIPNFAPPS